MTERTGFWGSLSDAWRRVWRRQDLRPAASAGEPEATALPALAHLLRRACADQEGPAVWIVVVVGQSSSVYDVTPAYGSNLVAGEKSRAN
jgi:hypothetical protein